MSWATSEQQRALPGRRNNKHAWENTIRRPDERPKAKKVGSVRQNCSRTAPAFWNLRSFFFFIPPEPSQPRVWSPAWTAVPLHPPHYKVPINWAGGEAKKKRKERKEKRLTSRITALASSYAPRTEATGRIHPVPPQPPRSLVYTSLGRGLLCIS